RSKSDLEFRRVLFRSNPDWFKAGVQNGEMYYGTHYGYGEVADYQYVTTQGDLTSYIWFKRKGNDVTIKMIGSTENQNVTGAPMRSEERRVGKECRGSE